MDPARDAASPAARFEDAVVTIDERRVLGPVTLTFGRGERWALLGPNGAGKTTLFSLLAAQRSPSAGHVEVLGEALGRTDMRRLRTRIGLVSHRVADALPWTRFLSEDGRAELTAELGATLDACAELETFVALGQLLAEWKATAAVQADPELRARLAAPVEAVDGRSVPAP